MAQARKTLSHDDLRKYELNANNPFGTTAFELLFTDKQLTGVILKPDGAPPLTIQMLSYTLSGFVPLVEDKYLAVVEVPGLPATRHEFSLESERDAFIDQLPEETAKYVRGERVQGASL